MGAPGIKDARPPFAGLDGKAPEKLFGALPTPCYILDEAALRKNGEILAGVAKRTGCKILLAQKAFSNFNLYPVLEPYLAGTEASGLYETRLGAEEMPGKEVHVFCGAYRADEFDELLRYADHIVFNSPASWNASAPRQRPPERAWGCASTRSARPRRDTPSTTPARRAAAWEPPATSGLRK